MGTILIIDLVIIFVPALLLILALCLLARSGRSRRAGRLGYVIAWPVFALTAVLLFFQLNKPGPVTFGWRSSPLQEALVLSAAASLGCILSALVFQPSKKSF